MEGGEPQMNGATSFINEFFFFSGTYEIQIGSYGEKKKPLHYIHSQDEPTRLLAGVALFTTKKDTSVTFWAERNFFLSCL